MLKFLNHIKIFIHDNDLNICQPMFSCLESLMDRFKVAVKSATCLLNEWIDCCTADRVWLCWQMHKLQQPSEIHVYIPYYIENGIIQQENIACIHVYIFSSVLLNTTSPEV